MTGANHSLFALMDFIMSLKSVNKIIGYSWAYTIPYHITYVCRVSDGRLSALGCTVGVGVCACMLFQLRCTVPSVLGAAGEEQCHALT